MGLYLVFLVYLLNEFLKNKYKFNYGVPEESRGGAVAMTSFSAPVCVCEKENAAFVSSNVLCEF